MSGRIYKENSRKMNTYTYRYLDACLELGPVLDILGEFGTL
jgi:hypothetical protein